jgi:hypothetical protein
LVGVIALLSDAHSQYKYSEEHFCDFRDHLKKVEKDIQEWSGPSRRSAEAAYKEARRECSDLQTMYYNNAIQTGQEFKCKKKCEYFDPSVEKYGPTQE